MPSHGYFLSIQRCDINGNLFTPEASGWLSSTDIDNIQKLDIKPFASTHGLTISPGNYYRIKLAGFPWVETNQYIYTGTCTNTVNFKINGQNTTVWPSAITINYNNGKPRIISDVSATVTCDNSYFLSVAQCNASGGVIAGTEKTKWLTASDKDYLSYFDIENFCIQNGLTLTGGNYYKVKWVAGNPWTEKAQVVYIAPCSNSISFDINGQTNAFPSAINIANGNDILLDGSSSLFCNNNYYVSVQECYSNGTGFGTEIAEWAPHSTYNAQEKVYYYSIGRYDIRDFCKRKNFDLGCGKYYRIKLATGSWVELSRVIYIQPCLNVNNSFEVENFNYYEVSKHCYVTNECFSTEAGNVTLYSPSSISCNQSYFISVQKRLNGNLTGTEAASWLNTQDIYDLKTVGIFNLKTFAKDPNHDGIYTDGFVLCDPSDPNYPNITYRVKLVAGAGSCNSYTWVENNKIIYFGGGSGRFANIDTTLSQVYSEPLDGMQIYPNPASNSFLINSSMEKEFSDLKIIDILGNSLKIFHNMHKQDIIDISEIPSGIYFVQGIFADGSMITKKLQVIK
jgi:hypothetical protein